MTKSLYLLLFFGLSFQVFAQTGEKNFIDLNYIEVQGSAEMEITPDIFYVKIILNEKDSKSKVSIEDTEKLMLKALTNLGINISTDLVIEDFTSNFKYYMMVKSDIMLSKEYQLLLHDAKTLQKVFLELEKLDISNVGILRTDHSNMEQFRLDVRAKAMQAAKANAGAMAGAINQSIGRAVLIQDAGIQSVINQLAGGVAGTNIRIRGISSDSKYDSGEMDIEFEKI
ncbi:MAG TPA: SIMPL domain-containing protein, partial [Bacteroidales bacterium]|nr:SIMPL domain-containing protein [Bacteroidales bacterium]